MKQLIIFLQKEWNFMTSTSTKFAVCCLFVYNFHSILHFEYRFKISRKFSDASFILDCVFLWIIFFALYLIDSFYLLIFSLTEINISQLRMSNHHLYSFVIYVLLIYKCSSEAIIKTSNQCSMEDCGEMYHTFVPHSPLVNCSMLYDIIIIIIIE